MARYNNGFENIKVELINWSGADLARQVCCFGQGAEFYTGFDSVNDYSEDNPKCKQIVTDIIRGDTFPKYALSGHNVAFSIKGISRVCLAQLTREGTSDTSTFFCSESSGTRPLTQEQIIPMNIYKNKQWMREWDKINEKMEKLYCEMLEAGIPFMDARYMMPHNQTINICYTASMLSFIGSCNKRLDHSIADEINYVYRLMIWELKKAILNLEQQGEDALSIKLWQWLIGKIGIRKPSKNATYRNDFKVYETEEILPFAHNDWRKSQWKLELERIYKTKRYLLTNDEQLMICNWLIAEQVGDKLNANYDKNLSFTPETSIKNMYYYKGGTNAKRNN